MWAGEAANWAPGSNDWNPDAGHFTQVTSAVVARAEWSEYSCGLWGRGRLRSAELFFAWHFSCWVGCLLGLLGLLGLLALLAAGSTSRLLHHLTAAGCAALATLPCAMMPSRAPLLLLLAVQCASRWPSPPCLAPCRRLCGRRRLKWGAAGACAATEASSWSASTTPEVGCWPLPLGHAYPELPVSAPRWVAWGCMSRLSDKGCPLASMSPC
jgi:hypothetical protein